MADPGLNPEQDTPHGQPDTNKPIEDNQEKDDPATTAARENLKHTTISDEPLDSATAPDTKTEDSNPVEDEKDAVAKTSKAATPEPTNPSDAKDEEMKEHISSPKKKRGREHDDETRDVEGGEKDDGEAIVLNGSTVQGGRTSTGPERKRHRDAPEDSLSNTPLSTELKEKPDSKSAAELGSISPKSEEPEKSADVTSKPIFGSNLKSPPQTSAEAFAKSGFGALAASSSSPFATVGASKPSVFGSGSTAPSGFAALAATKPKGEEEAETKSGFAALASQSSGNGFGSGFAAAPKNGFGSTSTGFGGGFGGGFGSPFATGGAKPLSSFAASKPDIIGTAKPAKPFGAPEEDEDEDGDEEEDEGDDDAEAEEEDKQATEEKKKLKLSRVPLNDGEEDEVTLLQFRAKLFALESKETGWKERGVGTLKVNVHKSCVEYDEFTGQPISGSFDPSLSAADDDDKDEPVLASRLIMRQENTHRVILNTLIIKAMKFEEKAGSSSVQVTFTAFHEGKPLNVLLRMSEANARLFLSEIASIQSELP